MKVEVTKIAPWFTWLTYPLSLVNPLELKRRGRLSRGYSFFFFKLLSFQIFRVETDMSEMSCHTRTVTDSTALVNLGLYTNNRIRICSMLDSWVRTNVMEVYVIVNTNNNRPECCVRLRTVPVMTGRWVTRPVPPS